MKQAHGRSRSGAWLPFAMFATAALTVSALINSRLAASAERKHPPTGRFINIDGLKLHVVERGCGPAIVLLHGNGSMIEDFEVSGLMEQLSAHSHVIAFDRPGFGHSVRTRDRIWTDQAQAELIHKALAELGIETAVVVGHSWGCSVAVALALRYPADVSGLVLLSGYYYPSFRLDAAMSSCLTLPVVGDILRYAVLPTISRVLWPLVVRKLFGPRAPSQGFARFPKALTFRPSQIRASAEDAVLMVPDASARSPRYAELKMPVAIVAGDQDRIVDVDRQSGRLHKALPQSTFRRLKGVGHMVHQTATSDVASAIDAIAAESRSIAKAA